MIADPKTASCSCGSPPAGAAATSVAFGFCSRSEETSQTSAPAISRIPTFSHPCGVTAASSTPSVTQLRAARIDPAVPPTSGSLDTHAITNRGTAPSAAHGLDPRIAHPSATAASGGTAINARYVSQVAVSDAYRIAKITPTIEAIGTSAQPHP